MTERYNPRTHTYIHEACTHNATYMNLVSCSTQFTYMYNCVKERNRWLGVISVFASHSIDTRQPTVSACYNAISACLTPLAFAQCGADPEHVNVYLVSFDTLLCASSRLVTLG